MGFLDWETRLNKLSKHGDPLEGLNTLIEWHVFMPIIDKAFKRERKSLAGRKPYNRLMMFKAIVLKSLYRLSDAQLEYQINDRMSFMRFLDLGLGDAVPDEKTLWHYQKVLTDGRVIDQLFKRFNRLLEKQGYAADLGIMVDASIVEVPKQRNSREDNKQIKQGEVPESHHQNKSKGRQKDVQARWTIKRGKASYGYKDHIHADVKYKLIRSYAVTAASTGDIKCLPELLSKEDAGKRLWADSAYDSAGTDTLLSELGIESRVTHRIRKGNWLPEDLPRENTKYAKIRKRVEHIFGFMENSMGGKKIRTIGLSRARTQIGMMNLVYNMCRYAQLSRLAAT